MSHLEKLTGELRTVVAGLDKARSAAAAADETAQRIADRAAGAGFAGIAANMSGVRQAITEARGRLDGVERLVNEVLTAVAAVPAELSPEQVIVVLSPVLESMGNARDGLAATTTTVEQASRLATAVLQGGQPGPMVSALEAIGRAVTEITGHTEAARHHVEAAIANARHHVEAAIANARHLGGQGN